MQIDPAEVRFTQDSIALYFQRPHEYFSIREAVRRISKNKMRPEEFPPIRIIQYGGFYWSIDNRRLWVFRYARCSSIYTVKLDEMHPRLGEVVANSGLLSMMKGAEFFPRVRDKGEKDWKFDLDFPQPSSDCGLRFPQPSSFLHRSRNDRFMKLPITSEAPNDKAEEHHEMHHRLGDRIVNPDLLSMMEGADFFPRVRDKGEKDRKFDLDFPQPSSDCGLRFPQPSSFLHRSRNDRFMKSPITSGAPNEKAEEHYSTKSSSGTPNDKPKEHNSTKSQDGAPYDEEREHTKDKSETETPFAGVIRKIFGYEQLAVRMIFGYVKVGVCKIFGYLKVAVGKIFGYVKVGVCKIFGYLKVAVGKIFGYLKAAVGRRKTNPVYRFFRYLKGKFFGNGC